MEKLFEKNAARDKSVVLWSIQDSITSLGLNKSGSSSLVTKDSPKLGPRGIFAGHDSTVEDVRFCPSRYLIMKSSLRGFNEVRYNYFIFFLFSVV